MKKENSKITLFVGLNDKKTKKQEIESDEAIKITNGCLLQYVEGATVYFGEGIYKHIDNTTIIEKNIIIILYNIDDERIKKIVEELKKTLNQETIGIERTTASFDFM